MIRTLFTLTVACALALPGLAAAQAPTSLESRLKQFEDKAEIERLLLDYGRHLDARDFGAYAALFAKDGEWVGGFGTVAGPASIKTFMEKAMPGANTGKSYHLLSNFVIAVQGDTATAWSRWAFVVPGQQGGAAISQAGRYDDTLVREDGRWRFRRRAASNDTGRPPAAAAR